MTRRERYDAAFRYDDDSDQAIGWRMRLCRLSTGLTQVRFAEKIGTTKGNLQNVERGRHTARPWQVKGAEDLTGCDFNFIYAGRYSRLDHELVETLLSIAEAEASREGDKVD